MSYIGNSPEFWNLNVNKYSYNAYAGQTIFSAIYDSVVDVYLNGLKLQSGTDYTATDGVSVILAVAALENDVIDIAGYFNMENFDITTFPQAVTKTSANGAVIFPAGTTSERPSVPLAGEMRYNTELSAWEGYSSSTWKSVGGGAVGGGSDAVFNLNDQTVTTSYTIPTGKNALTAGPVAIANTATVTVPSGSIWTIV